MCRPGRGDHMNSLTVPDLHTEEHERRVPVLAENERAEGSVQLSFPPPNFHTSDLQNEKG